jgi:hypothetical protein
LVEAHSSTNMTTHHANCMKMARTFRPPLIYLVTTFLQNDLLRKTSRSFVYPIHLITEIIFV